MEMGRGVFVCVCARIACVCVCVCVRARHVCTCRCNSFAVIFIMQHALALCLARVCCYGAPLLLLLLMMMMIASTWMNVDSHKAAFMVHWQSLWMRVTDGSGHLCSGRYVGQCGCVELP